MLLLDVVQATGVWFQDGCVMEHLVESDAQEDHVELRERDKRMERERERERGREVGMKLVYFLFQFSSLSIRVLCSTKPEHSGRTWFPTLPNRAQNPMKPRRRCNGLLRDLRDEMSLSV